MDLLNCSPQNWIENESIFMKQLEDYKVWNSIPLLNVNELHNFKDSTLVRFRGMIQDMHSPEFYLEKFEVIDDTTKAKTYRNGKYCDLSMTEKDESISLESELNVISKRYVYVVISVPGINNWVRAIEENQFKMELSKPVDGNTKLKRTFHEAMDMEDSPMQMCPSSSSIGCQKKVCNQSRDSNNTENSTIQSLLSKEHVLNFPLPDDQNCKTCHIKLYKNEENLKLNDMCEFVGFLGIDPITEAAYEDNELQSTMECEFLHLPSSLVPKIHCVSFMRLKHNNPLLLHEDDNIQSDTFEVIYKELLIVFTQLLLGDKLAAEYLIYNLISEVYMRRDDLALGKFCLNISNIPKLENLDYVSELYKFIEILVPKSCYLPMTLENMNNLSFIPKHDHKYSCLKSGILQLSQNTHVILDETKLCSGKLNSSGINGLRALDEAIKHQKLTYDFMYYPLEFDCNIPFLILSEGKSLLGSDVHVVLLPEKNCINTFAEIVIAAKYFLKSELLNDIRKFLTLARLIKYEIPSSMEDFIQQEFVSLRQTGNVSAYDLHSLLVLARFMTIAQGKTILNKNCWRRACELENQRKARIVK